ncbi:DUF4097 family beta strand repeat-containing protein [Paenibacillus whitsoniae]|uniref:DUF4097 domain-containing protein n=1 Tax=Paenibacillus whitsoniae TaxID=2496558 RepID=A0A430JAB0_9BACL|nr:DUF4097 family beta strand repeat-containing protein [Paenibacillus whitsoniae]RTE07954.1 hypothetical protein EJQ19_20130 [Paenibacillus whitsoniae]
MQRGVKFSLFLGFVLLAVGLVGAAVTFKSLDLTAGFSTVNVEKKVAAAGIDTIILNTDTSSISFVPSNTDEISVSLSGKLREANAANCTLEATTENATTWRIDACTRRGHINFGFDIDEFKSLFSGQKFGLKTEVRVPDKLFKAITVKSDTGLIDLGSLKSDKLTVTSDTGSVHIDHFEGKLLNVQTDTGSIRVDDAQGDIKLRTDTGPIDAVLAEIGNEVSLSADTGSIRLKVPSKINNVSFDLRSDVGSARLNVPAVDVQESSRTAVKGIIGDGSKKVKATTDTGFIEVRTRD